ncbi:hypothetical protein GCT13_22525 [Paraburkholderia sp. CNPSo 3157]|uniref:Uncharacterized protein n=1 Tax=Paraburkholderia franconis TaxID=2654983 RepID=A0A7X1NDK6_9BURK|nr:hypothetical protein [Paraburkholderia franconis]MPW19606.1 hypothetical protein [Paraburkholderia franconis]
MFRFLDAQAVASGGFYNMEPHFLMLAPALGLVAALLIKWEPVGATIEESDGQHRTEDAVLEGNIQQIAPWGLRIDFDRLSKP